MKWVKVTQELDTHTVFLPGGYILVRKQFSLFCKRQMKKIADKIA